MCTQLALLCTFAHIADLPPQDVIKSFTKWDSLFLCFTAPTLNFYEANSEMCPLMKHPTLFDSWKQTDCMFHLFDLFSLFSSRACAFNTTFCLNNGVSSQSSQNFEGFLGGVKNSTEVLFFWTNLMVTSDGFGWLLALQERQSVCCSACVITDKRACQRESQRAHTRPHTHAVTILLTWQASHVHFLQVFGLQDDHGQLAGGGHVSQGEADIAQLLLLLGDIT